LNASVSLIADEQSLWWGLMAGYWFTRSMARTLVEPLCATKGGHMRSLVTCLLSLALSAELSAQVVPNGARPDKVFDGGVFLEGPAAAPDGTIYFSDITNPATTGMQLGHIWRYDPKTGKATIFRSPSGQSNGLEFDAAGRLVAVEGGNGGGRRVTRTDMATGRTTALALNFNGRAFNSPNDLTIDELGRVWFTDPRYSGPEPIEQPVMGVYRIDANGTVALAIANAGKPNGVVMAPDQKTLYVAANDNGAMGPLPQGVAAQPGRRAILAYDIAVDGSASFRNVLVDMSAGGPDGIAVDVAGNVWVAVASAQSPSVCAYSAAGAQLGCITIPEVPSNVAFGRGSESRTLYVTARTSLYRVRVGVEGYQLPRE
jgi:gluconolactonase